MSTTFDRVLGLALVALGAWGLPWLGMRAIVPSLSVPERLRPNYRGRPVFLGLGLVWLFWALGVMTVVWLARFLPGAAGHAVPLLSLGFWPVTVCFALGFVDDVFGTSADKGIAGHLRALRQGRLTTGGLKLLGIGFVSLQAAVGARLWAGDSGTAAAAVIEVVLAAVVIAGFANLLNLLDLRPGRALKSYLALAALAWVLWVAAAVGVGSLAEGGGAFTAVALLIAFAGPALAVWPYDLGEKGMLGDAGANPAGALVGVALAASLSTWGLAVAAALVVAANLASERWSFSRVIEHNRVLSWWDGLGRGRDAATDRLGDSPPEEAQDDASHSAVDR